MKTKLEGRGHTVDFVDPQKTPLPFVDLMYKEFDKGKAPENIEKIHKIFDAADGYIFVAPEYNHGISGVLKNTLDIYQKEFFFKPAGIVSYSSGGFGGIRGVEQLRLVCIELGMVPTPIAIAVSTVEESFEEPGQPAAKSEERYKRSFERFIGEYEWYLKVLKDGRKTGTPY